MILTLLYQFFSRLFLCGLHVSHKNAFPPPLSGQEEAALLERMKNGDEQARNSLIEHNLRLVVHIVKKYYAIGHNQDDLISIGTIGLIKAVSTFKPEKGSKLTTYAARCIENEILMYFRSLRKSAQDVYISDPIDIDKDGNALTVGDLLSDEVDIVENIDKKIKLEQLSRICESALTKREWEILSYRYGLNDREELTQHELAKRLGISRSYVSRIEKAALARLRPYFK